MDSLVAKGQELFGSIKGSISGHQSLSSNSSYSSYSSQPAYAGTAAFGSYQATPGGVPYSAPSYSYSSPPPPPPASTSSRPAKSTSPAASKPSAPSRTPEQSLDDWLDEKPKVKKSAARKKAAASAESQKAADLISLEPPKPVDPFAELLSGPAPTQDDAFAGFATTPAPAGSGDVDPFEAFSASAPAPAADGAAADEEDPFAAFLSSTARPASAPPAPAAVSTVEELVAAPPSSVSDTVVPVAASHSARTAKSTVTKPRAQKPVKPAAPVSRAAVDKLKDTTGNKRNDEILRELLRLPANQTCADCSAPYPDWASVNLGVFVCLKCSGHHRNLGTHISKVRSVNLDTWTPDQLAVMQSVGNENARLVYEASLPANYPRPTPFTGTGELLAWIKDKYEYGRFKAKPTAPTAATNSPGAAAPQASPARKRRPKKAASASEDTPAAEEP